MIDFEIISIFCQICINILRHISVVQPIFNMNTFFALGHKREWIHTAALLAAKLHTGRPVSNPSTSCVSIWNKKKKLKKTCEYTQPIIILYYKFTTKRSCAATELRLFCYLVVVSAEIFKVSEADVREADDDCDDQNHKREHGGGSCKAFVQENDKEI